MGKGPSGVEDPILHGTVMNADGRWMVFACVDGRCEKLGFLGSRDDAADIAKALNERDQARYKHESAAAVGSSFKSKSFKEIAEDLGITWIDE